MSQQDFANLIGISLSTVNNWDNHKTSVQPMIRPRILAVLKSLGFAKVEFEEYEDAEETVDSTTG